MNESLYDVMKYVGIMSNVKWRCYDLLNMMCLVYGGFLGTLGGSNIMGFYLHIALVWLGGCIRWWFLCEDYVLWCAYDSMNICGWIDEGYM